MGYNFNEKDMVAQNTFVEFKEVGAEVEGILKSIEDGLSGQMFVVQKEDKTLVLIGSYKTLQGRFKDEDVGMAIKVIYKGEHQGKTKGVKPYKVFEVYKKKV